MSSKNNLISKIVSVMLVVIMTVLLGLNPLCDIKVNAAQKKIKYLKEVRLFIKENGTYNDAKAWCDEQNKDGKSNWETIEESLIQGYVSRKDYNTTAFLCYQTTTDSKEAIRDLAVMNEYGNFDVGAYELILKEQKEVFADMVDDLKDMLEEYRTNYKNGVETAVQAHDILNGYVEDDSKALFGDYLIDATDDELVNVLLQANGKVVITLEEELAYAADTKNTTWLDRMEKLGSYNTLRKKYIKAYNNNTTKADKALKIAYNDKAVELSGSWEDIKQHIDNCRKYEKTHNLSNMSEKEFKQWYITHEVNEDSFIYEQEKDVLAVLAAYSYDGGSLLDYFAQDYEDICGENIYKLYPLVASLSDGQKAAADQWVSLFSLVQNAANSTVYNELDTQKANTVNEEMNSSEMSDVLEQKEELEEKCKLWVDSEPVSIYEGVDREVYDKGGVAVTSAAEKFSHGKAGNWTDSFVESYKIYLTSGGLAAGSILSGVGAWFLKNAMRNTIVDAMDEIFERVHMLGNGGYYGLSRETTHLIMANNDLDTMLSKTSSIRSFSEERQKYFNAIEDLADKSVAQVETANRLSLLSKLKIGFTIFAVILAIADIVITSIALYNYYNRDHIPIPHHMVDLSYDEDKETSYISYRAVRNQKNEIEDMYGNKGKQWLCMYYTKDEDAGDPILAPDGDLNKMISQRGNSKTPVGYAPLHIFGEINAAQNLTVAGGESGWTYNDFEEGNYFFFVRDINEKTYESEAGSVFSAGRVAFISGLGVVCGLMLGVLGTNIYNKRKIKISK